MQALAKLVKDEYGDFGDQCTNLSNLISEINIEALEKRLVRKKNKL